MERINLLFNKIINDGDEQAFKELFMQYFSSLCVFAHRYIDSWETCEDIVQDAFLKIWENKNNLTINKSAKNFLITTIRNHCLDFLRHQEMEKLWIEKRLQLDAEEDNDDLYSLTELQELIKKSLSKLPASVVQSFDLSRNKAKSYEEIAEIQNISIRKVESNISIVLKHLRHDLKDYLPIIFILLVNKCISC